MLSVGKSEPIPCTWGTSWRGIGQGIAPETFLISAALCTHAFVHRQSGANPGGTETNRKTSAGPSYAGWELGQGLGGEQAGSPIWLAEREGDPPKQNLVPHPLCHLYDSFQFF